MWGMTWRAVPANTAGIMGRLWSASPAVGGAMRAYSTCEPPAAWRR